MEDPERPSSSGPLSRSGGSAKSRSGLDYDLRFPSASGRRLEKDPVVVLLGWAGAKDQYLAKYTDIYYDEGCISVRYILPPVLTFHGEREELEAIGSELCSVVEELELVGHPLLFHVFSGNGCLTLAAFLRALDGRASAAELGGALCGLIFDSCPAKASLWQRAKALTEAGFADATSATLKMAVFWVAYAYLSAQYAWRWFAVRFLGRPQPLHYYDELAASPLVRKTPQLYIYSDGDEICSADSIEAFMGRMRSLSCDVEGGRLLSSPHCQHYRRHPIEYTRLVAHFLHRVVRFE